MVPSLIPEAVLGTKEPSEKTRSAAFDVIVALGQKMSKGGVVRRDMMDGMDEDEDGAGSGAGDGTPFIKALLSQLLILTIVAASVEEYMTMVAGGLAGASPHMISATVTAISRLVFEFKGESKPCLYISRR
jgi:ribosomal RNA-processing protein 12